MLTQLYYADFTQIIYAIHYAFYAVITQIIYADFTQIIYAIHYAVYAIHLRRHIYAITIISLRRLRKYRFHYASLRKGQLADVLMIRRRAASATPAGAGQALTAWQGPACQ